MGHVETLDDPLDRVSRTNVYLIRTILEAKIWNMNKQTLVHFFAQIAFHVTLDLSHINVSLIMQKLSLETHP